MSTILVKAKLSAFLTTSPLPPRLEGELKECNIIPPGQDPAQTKETYWILQKRKEEPVTDFLTSIFFAKTGSNQWPSLMPSTVKCWLWPLVPIVPITDIPVSPVYSLSPGISWLVPSISDHSLQTPTNGTFRLRQLVPDSSDTRYLITLKTGTCWLRQLVSTLVPADSD